MPESASLLDALLPVIFLVACGVICKQVKLFNQEVDAVVARLVINVLLPAFIFDSLTGNPAVSSWREISGPPLLGFGIIIASLICGFAIAPFIGIRHGVQRRTFAYATSIFNYGYLPIPIVTALFGKETLATLLAFNVGVDFAIWTLGVVLLSGDWNRECLKRLFNPIVLAFIAAVTFNLTALAQTIPSPVLAFTEQAGSIAIPLGILIIGSVLRDFAFSVKWKSDKHVPVAACLLRLILYPLAMIALTLALPLSLELKRVVMVQAAMPCGIFVIMFAKMFNGSVETATKIVVSTSIASIISLPFVLQLALNLL